MLNQNNYYFNRVLTYFDQGGNNIWWSATNNIIKTTPKAEIVLTGQGIDSECIEADCIPICSVIVESEQQNTELLTKPQKLVYPTFIIDSNKLTINFNNLYLKEQPNYIEDGCIDSSCVEEFGIWTKAIKTQIKTTIDNQTYYFIKANLDGYGYAYIYNISLIHEITGEEIVITKNKGILNSIIVEDIIVPEEFTVAISVTKFNIEEIITTYKFINNPLYLRSNWNTNLPWQPINNNIEEVLFSIIYLLNTGLDIEDKNKLILYKESPQQILINILLNTINSITTDNSINYSYIKSSTNVAEYNELVTNNLNEFLLINPAIYSTTQYTPQEDNSVIYLLLLIVISLTNNRNLLQTYIDKCININTINLKENVLKVIAFTEAYKLTNDIYTLSIATTTLNSINKRYKLDTSDLYIESLENPITTTESKVYGDLLNYYVYNKEVSIYDYLLESITYITNIDLYLNNSSVLLTEDPVHLLILNLLNIDLKSNNKINKNTKLVDDVLNLSLSNYYLSNTILNSIDLFKTETFNTFKSTIPNDFSWLSTVTPVQDIIINSVIKPIIDLYIHSKYQKEINVLKDALTILYDNNIIINKQELLSKTFTTDTIQIRNSLWPGKYSNSVDVEIKGYYDSQLIEFIDNIKSLGIEMNLISSINMPTINNFSTSINIVEKDDFGCQEDAEGQLILLSNCECLLTPPELSILLQENNDPITQETSLIDYILI